MPDTLPPLTDAKLALRLERAALAIGDALQTARDAEHALMVLALLESLAWLHRACAPMEATHG